MVDGDDVFWSERGCVRGKGTERVHGSRGDS
jgi:hypothetical protein